MKRHGSIFLFLASALPAAPLSPGWPANPPPADPVPEDCECRCGCCETVSDGCTMVKADLGVSTPESGSVPLSLEICFDAEAWDVFRRDRLLMAYGGFGFSRFGQGRKQDGATPDADGTAKVFSWRLTTMRGGVPSHLVATVDGAPMFADISANPPRWLYDTSWNLARVVVRGAEVGGSVVPVKVSVAGTVFYMRG